jgi:hypothetical protein
MTEALSHFNNKLEEVSSSGSGQLVLARIGTYDKHVLTLQ